MVGVKEGAAEGRLEGVEEGLDDGVEDGIVTVDIVTDGNVVCRFVDVDGV
jgi:hypothetical protein